MQQSSFHEYLDNKLLWGLLQNVQQKETKPFVITLVFLFY